MDNFQKKLIRLLHFVFFAGVTGLCSVLTAKNPIVGSGISDPHVRVFGEKVYLYCGHDQHPDDKLWDMRKWQIYSTTNLVDWKFENNILPEDNYMGGDSRDCWAGDASSRNGKYYFYFSDQKRSIGVMSSDSPSGPFVDALGKALVSPMHDPTLFVDDDPGKTPYLLYGEKSQSYRIAKLNDDIISLAEEPIDIEIRGEEWKKAPDWMDKSYLFKHDGRYYLSWGRDYAVSDHIYGPYDCWGAVGKGHHLNEFAHGSFFEWKGQFYHVWCYYLRKLDQYYYKYRNTIMTYCHFDDQGRIVTDTGFLDQHYESGVGNYDTSWGRIEAEWYYEKTSSVQKSQCIEGGFQLSGFSSGEWVRYANVTTSTQSKEMLVRVKNSGPPATLSVVLNDPDGEFFCKIRIPETGESYQTLVIPIETLPEKFDLIFRIDSEEVCLDWFQFTSDAH